MQEEMQLLVTEPLALSAEQVSRLTGLSRWRLSYWDETGFYAPRFASDDRGRPFGRIYSFRDVVGLRILAKMRNEEHIPLQELRRVSDWLKERYNEPWASLRFYVAGRKILFDEPESGQKMILNPPGQVAFPFFLQEVMQEMRAATQRLRERSDEDLGRIVRNRYLVHNTPVLAGTRIPTSAIWNFHQEGYTPQEIIREYPRLTPRDVEAAISYERKRKQKQAG